MNQGASLEAIGRSKPVDGLVEIADSMFDRAVKLDGIKEARRGEEASKAIAETRDETYRAVIEVWRVVLDLLPHSGLEHSKRKDLEIDAHKVISRCHHRLNELEGARQSITKAIDLGYVEGFISLGAICLDMKEYKAAEAAFRSALSKEVQTMRAHAGLGEMYFAMGTNALKQNLSHKEHFEKAEEEFLLAGKERFHESFERAMDLFETIGWKDKALAFGKKAVQFYENHRLGYGERLRFINSRIRSITTNERHDRLIAQVGRRLGDLVGGKERDPNR